LQNYQEGKMEPVLREEEDRSEANPNDWQEELHQLDNDESESHSSDYDDDEDDDDIANPPSPGVLGPYDGGRMALGATERRWALQIKEAVMASAEIDNLTDFMYAQWAIVSLAEHQHVVERVQEDMPALLERILSLQDLREEYLVKETLQDGCQLMEKVICRLLPGWFLSFNYMDDRGCYLRVASITKFDMSIFTFKDRARMWLAAVYYINHAHCPDLEAVRQGFVQYIECKGYEWRSQSMLNIKAFSEAAPSFALYPILVQETIHYNSGTFVRLLSIQRRV
jgi:uncharacterized coiled-coil protein SlyX